MCIRSINNVSVSQGVLHTKQDFWDSPIGHQMDQQRYKLPTPTIIASVLLANESPNLKPMSCVTNVDGWPPIWPNPSVNFGEDMHRHVLKVADYLIMAPFTLTLFFKCINIGVPKGAHINQSCFCQGLATLPPNCRVDWFYPSSKSSQDMEIPPYEGIPIIDHLSRFSPCFRFFMFLHWGPPPSTKARCFCSQRRSSDTKLSVVPGPCTASLIVVQHLSHQWPPEILKLNSVLHYCT